MTSCNLFSIAGHLVHIVFKESDVNSMALLPSFEAFHKEEEENGDEEIFFSMTVDDNLRPCRQRDLIRKFDTGNGDTIVHLLPDGGYQYIIRNTEGHDCCLLRTNRDFSECTCALNGTWSMRSFGLNDALMLVFAFRGSHCDTLLIHASCVMHGGRAYPFIAKSGTGKSTHSSLWLKHIDGTELMNDDNPAIRIVDGEAYVYGTPWSGKTPCYRNIKARLGAITRIDRAPENSIERMRPAQAFASLLPSCSSMKWDSKIYNNICDTLTRIIESVPVYTMHCLPDEEAAQLCHKTITRQ